MSTRIVTLEASENEKKLRSIYDEAMQDWDTNYRPIELRTVQRTDLTQAGRDTGMGMLNAEARQQSGALTEQQINKLLAAGVNPGSGNWNSAMEGLNSATSSAVGMGLNQGSMQADLSAYQDLAEIATRGVSHGTSGVSGMGMGARYQQAADNIARNMHQNASDTKAAIRAQDIGTIASGLATGATMYAQKGMFDKPAATGIENAWVGGDAYTQPTIFDTAQQYTSMYA